MKIFWATNIPLQPLLKKYGNLREAASGSWMNSLVSQIAKCHDIEIGIVSPFQEKGKELCKTFVEDGITYYHFTPPSYYLPITPYREGNYQRKILGYLKQALDDFQPDILHVHGVEQPWGLIKENSSVSIPVIVSIQGILEMCKRNAWGDMNLFDILKMQKNTPTGVLRLFPNLWKKVNLSVRIKREQRILSFADCIIGRTLWDKAYARGVAPNTPYREQHEIMRPSFYTAKWRLKGIKRYSIFSAGRVTFAKGIHVLIKAISLLKEDYPEVLLHYAGSYSSRDPEWFYIKRLILRENLQNNIQMHGHLNSDQMVQLMCESHSFATASFVENGCNALQEAQLLGMPCVATYAGGMTTTGRDEETALMTVVGNEYMLAEQIRRIFSDDQIALQLSKVSRAVAMVRNNPENIVRQLLCIYKEFFVKKRFVKN